MQLPHPVLVIGLGGTGQWIACHFLKELMDLYGLNEPNEVLSSPKIGGRVRILAFDTDQGNPARVGRGSRAPGMGVGEVRLPDPMRLSVGAQIMSYAQNVANGRYPEIGSWFDAGWFLNQPTAVNLLNLTTGAQQFRPLGRVAVPYNLTQVGGGIRNSLEKAISDIASAARNSNLLVCIAGSLCGGTGAGMVADVAYLVQKIAAGRVPAVSTRAYLVLPNAFEGTVQRQGGVGFGQRAFAAMRELRRFAREVNYQVGYSMYYAGPEQAGDEVVRGRAKQALFELLYYFDSGLVKSTGSTAKVEEGMAPLIAEVILPWVDGQTTGQFLSHASNLTAAKVARVPAILSPQAAVAGGIGLYSLQLPIQEIIEEWTYRLAREALKRFLGVREEDATTKTATQLWDNRPGGREGISGSAAARTDWEGRQIGNRAVSEFIQEVLKSGRAGREGPERKAARQTELTAREAADWQRILAPQTGATAEDETLMAEFLYPPDKVLERGGIFNRPNRVAKAQVPRSDDLSGDARRREQKSPRAGAERVEKDINAYLDKHLGPINWATSTRGGDTEPSGAYPTMLRRWCCKETGCKEGGHVAEYRELLRHWVALSLNGTAALQRTADETPDKAVENRSGRLGYTLALLSELSAMLSEAVSIYRNQESIRLGLVVEARGQLPKLAEELKKEVRHQLKYLEQQQKVLEQERAYACTRAVRWSADEMLKCTQQALEGLKRWRDALCGDKGLHQAVWKAQEQVATNLALLKEFSAVREVVEVPETKAARYQHYAETNLNALGETLNALRWQVEVEPVYDEGLGRRVPNLVVGFRLGDEALTPDSRDRNQEALMSTCRQFFETAREHETVLGWLRDYYNNSSPERQVTTLAQRLSQMGNVTLRMDAGANSYVVAYVRSHWRNDTERNWVQALLTLIARNMDADREGQRSEPVDSTDPYRLTLVSFHELIDVEKLTTYSGGRSTYSNLPARSDGTNLARQLLHVFAAERNAAVYEEQLGRLLPDRIVALLEEPERFRQFVHAWAYGSYKDDGGAETLIRRHRVEDGAGRHAGQWVYRLTTGPFKDDLHPDTLLPRPAQHWWLCEPVAQETLSLFQAAETFCLRGADKWQAPGQSEEGVPLNYKRVERSINERRQALLTQPDIGKEMPELKTIVEGISNETMREQAKLRLAELEYFQRLLTSVIPSLQQGRAGRANSGNIAGQDFGQDDKEKLSQAEKLTFGQLDPDLYDLMRLVIADELRSLMRNLRDYRSA